MLEDVPVTVDFRRADHARMGDHFHGEGGMATGQLCRKMKTSLLGLLFVLLTSSNASACSCSLRTLDDRAKYADAIYIATLQQAKLVIGEYDKEWSEIEGRFRFAKR